MLIDIHIIIVAIVTVVTATDRVAVEDIAVVDAWWEGEAEWEVEEGWVEDADADAGDVSMTWTYVHKLPCTSLLTMMMDFTNQFYYY